MKERQILFSGSMIRAILSGSKYQTRRIIKFQAPHLINKVSWRNDGWYYDTGNNCYFGIKCPYGQPGDQLWVRETVWVDKDTKQFKWYAHQDFFNVDPVRDNARLCPSIHMKRDWSRIQLEITGVRVERLQSISGMDAKREGVSIPAHMPQDGADLDWALREYKALWESINGAGSWDANTWVWVIEFRRINHASNG